MAKAGLCVVEEASRGVLGSREGRELVNIRVFFLQMMGAVVIFSHVCQVGETLIRR